MRHAPQGLKLVETPCVLQEDVDHKIVAVDYDPLAHIVAVHAQKLVVLFAAQLVHTVGKALGMAHGIGRGHDHDVRKGATACQIDFLDVCCLVFLKPGDNVSCLFGCGQFGIFLGFCCECIGHCFFPLRVANKRALFSSQSGSALLISMEKQGKIPNPNSSEFIPCAMRCKAVLFDIKNETLPREDLAKLQLKRLQDVCRRVYANVPFYKKRFDEMGVKPEDIRSLDDLRRLPFTVKQDLRNNYPYGLFALPRANLARIQASSGTTGQAIVMGYTQRDLDNWAELVARCMCASGVTPTDIVHVAYGYGLFTGGLGAHDGAQKLGAMVVPASGGATRRQGQLLRDLGATVLACTPSFALHLWESAMEIGIDFRELPLKIGIFGGEPWSETMRHTMEEKMGIDAHNIYGLTEIMGPGVAIDCMEHNGIHLWEDHFIAEIIDPETGENLPEGEVGELVITTITKEGAPLIRYRTRDLTSIDTTPCRCGRTHLRLTRLAGRTDDMLIIRGVNVFPQQIESLLMEIPGLSPNYLIVVDRKGTLDTIEVQVEITQQLFNDRISDLQALEKRLQGNIKEYCGVTARIRLMEPHSLDRSGGKATRVIDNRPKMN